jgi:hypothetical protein
MKEFSSQKILRFEFGEASHCRERENFMNE